MGVLSALEARPRRRASVTLVRPEAETATRIYLALSQRIKAAEEAGVGVEAARAALDEHLAQVKDMPEPDVVELVALEPEEFEELRARYVDLDSGELDRTAMRAPLIAACCVDPADRDVKRWETVLTDGSLHQGAVESLWQAAYGLNAEYVPVEYLTAPKG